MIRTIAISTALFLAVTAQGDVLQVGGVDLPTRQGDLHLHGAGLLRKGVVFKVYVGALYVATADDVERILEAVPKRLDIHYFHKTPRKHMVRVAEAALKQNLSAEQYAAHAPRIEELHKAYRDGNKGGCASLAYHPGEGLTYAVDGETVVTLRDDAFANDYFRVWLGKTPSSTSMKEALLRKLEADS